MFFDASDIFFGVGFSLIQIPSELKVEPKLSIHAKQPLEAKRRIRCHPAFAVYQFIHSRVRDTDSLRKLYLRHFERH